MTSLKIACRRLGVQRWPYSRSRNVEQREEGSSSHEPSDVHASGSTDSLVAAGMDDSFSVEDVQLSVEVPLLSPTESNESIEQQTCSSDEPSIDHKWVAWFLRCDDLSPVFKEEEVVRLEDEARQRGASERRQSYPSCHQPHAGISEIPTSSTFDFYSASSSSSYSYPGLLPNTDVAEPFFHRSFSCFP